MIFTLFHPIYIVWTESQLQKAKAYVRKELDIVVETKVPDYNWVRQHQFELENLKRK